MGAFVNEEVQRLSAEQQLIADIEENQQTKGDQFGDIEKVGEWNKYEVADWLDKKVQLTEYMMLFFKNDVDGSMLVMDLGREELHNQLGVKRVHVDKLMRHIVDLRDAIRTEWDESDFFDVIPHLIMNDERAMDKIEALKGEISKLEEEKQSMKEDFERRIQDLLARIDEKDAIIALAEQQGFDPNDDNKDNSDYESDLMDNTASDSDMPELIEESGYISAQNESHNPTDEQSVANSSHRNSIQNENPMTPPSDGVVDSNQTVPVDAPLPVESTEIDMTQQSQTLLGSITEHPEEKREEDDSFLLINSEDAPGGANGVTVNGLNKARPDQTLTPPQIDKMLPPAPAMTAMKPSSSAPDSALEANTNMNARTHYRKNSTGSTGSRRKHHRKNSTKVGFWDQNRGKRKPPPGTKAYWS